MYKLKDLVYHYDQSDYSKPINVHNAKVDKEALINGKGEN